MRTVYQMPQPPAEHVLSVYDVDDVELRRYNRSGTLWLDYGDGSAVSWERLVYKRGPITDGRLAP
jgi:hypothetical protein